VRVSFVLALLALVAGLAAGEVRKASDVFAEGRRRERAGDLVSAYLLYSQAAALNPQNPEYWLRSQALRPKALLSAQAGAESLPDTVPAPATPQTSTLIPDADLADSRRPQPPMELKALSGRKDLDLRGNARELFERVAEAYGLDVIFDVDYQPGASIRFRLDQAGYREALHALEATTASFVTPLSERLFLVAKDTPQKRTELELTATVAIPLPEPITVQEAQESARGVQQALQMTRVMVDTTRRIVVLRDRVSRVRPALELFRQLLRRPAEVAIEVEFLELGSLSSLSYGTTLPARFPLVYFGDLLNSKPSIPQGFTKFLTFGGGATLFGIGVTDADLFATMSRSSGHTLLRSVIRSLNGQEASLHVGERFPIITSAFILQTQGGQTSVPPAFNFEDLGLILKVKPQVHGLDEVSLDINAEFKVLTGQALNGIPVIANRKLESKVRLRSGRWALVAGLMDASEARSITGPAGLSRLPVIGPLVRSTDRTNDARQVLLVLKPAVLSAPPGESATEAVFLGAESRPRTPL